MWITKKLNQVLKDKLVVYKVTVYYDFVNYGYFMEGSNNIIRVLGYNLLIKSYLFPLVPSQAIN